MIAARALAAVYREAAAAAPAECCGWIEGDRVRPCRNASARPDAFAFSDADLVAFHAVQLPLVVYHSHPGGSAELSADDRMYARLVRVSHLVVALDASGAPREARLYAGEDLVEVARFGGAR